MKLDMSKQEAWRGVMKIRKSKGKAAVTVILSVLVIGMMIGQENRELSNIIESTRSLRSLFSSYISVRNSDRVKTWRDSASKMCESASSEEEVEAAREMASGAFVYYQDEEEVDVRDRVFTKDHKEEEEEAFDSDGEAVSNDNNNDNNSQMGEEEDTAVFRCPFVLLDLGSGAGDSVGEFIDAGAVSCPAKTGSDGEEQQWEEPHFDVDSGLVSFRSPEKQKQMTRKGENDDEFMQWARDRLARFSESIGPEDYCVYGVEGSPMLKPDLLKLQRHIKKMSPRPLRHLHFFTETIALDTSHKRKTLYLDTTDGAQRFPGSSVFESHESIVNSRIRDSELMDFSATTISLSQLMTDTLSFYHPVTSTATDDPQQALIHTPPPDLELIEKNSRNHLLLNVDIEGSEYHVLNEVKDSGLLCDFAKAGNQVDIFIQYHDPKVVGVESANAKRWIKEVRPYFRRNCGDNISFYERNRYFMPPSPPRILTNAIV